MRKTVKQSIGFLMLSLIMIGCLHRDNRQRSFTGRWDSYDTINANSSMSFFFRKNLDVDSLINNYVFSYEVYSANAICSDSNFCLAKFYYDTSTQEDTSIIIKVADGECRHNGHFVDSFFLKLDIIQSKNILVSKILDSSKKEICCLPTRTPIVFKKS